MQVVLAPVVLGAVLNQSFPRQMKQVEPVAPLIAVMMTVSDPGNCKCYTILSHLQLPAFCFILLLKSHIGPSYVTSKD